MDPFSRSIALVTISFCSRDAQIDQELATGSGIIRYHGGQNYLITALHNFTGREPDGRVKHYSGALPNRVKIEGFWAVNQCNLYRDGNDPAADTPLYWMHHSGAEIDIGILPLGYGGRMQAALDESFFDETRNAGSVRLAAMQLCHIVGFPEGLVDRSDPNHPLPVYKSGYIASEPETDFQGKPIVLIDAVTRPGQSGSPVFVRALGHNDVPTGHRWVGIYVGRLTSTSQSGNEFDHWSIGRVFKPRIVAEIFATHGA
jgi:hypothetical protein